jgi:hypothetical protein
MPITIEGEIADKARESMRFMPRSSRVVGLSWPGIRVLFGHAFGPSFPLDEFASLVVSDVCRKSSAHRPRWMIVVHDMRERALNQSPSVPFSDGG